MILVLLGSSEIARTGFCLMFLKLSKYLISFLMGISFKHLPDLLF